MDGYVLLVFLLASLGLGILMIEMFIPTAGMLAVLSGTCFLGAFYCAYQAWYQTGQWVWWWGFVVGFLVVVPSVLFGGLYWMPRTAFGRELFVAPQGLKELEPFQDEEALLRKLVNQRGKATALFSPGGMVQVGAQRFHAESEGVVIEPGDDVIVLSVKGNRLVVRPVSSYDAVPSQSEALTASASEPLNAEVSATTPESKAAERSIDFDFDVDS